MCFSLAILYLNQYLEMHMKTTKRAHTQTHTPVHICTGNKLLQTSQTGRNMEDPLWGTREIPLNVQNPGGFGARKRRKKNKRELLRMN